MPGKKTPAYFTPISEEKTFSNIDTFNAIKLFFFTDKER